MCGRESCDEHYMDALGRIQKCAPPFPFGNYNFQEWVFQEFRMASCRWLAQGTKDGLISHRHHHQQQQLQPLLWRRRLPTAPILRYRIYSLPPNFLISPHNWVNCLPLLRTLSLGSHSDGSPVGSFLHHMPDPSPLPLNLSHNVFHPRLFPKTRR